MPNVSIANIDNNASTGAGAFISSLWADLFPAGLVEELSEHQFLTGCRDRTVTKAALTSFLVQHQYYSSHFTRYLCAMMASLPSSYDMREISANLFEEMGLNTSDKITHSELYNMTLSDLGVRPDSEPQLQETKRLQDTMYHYCRSSDPLDGLSALCLGAEAIVPIIYGAVIDGLHGSGENESSLYYFQLHVSEDENHALTMRRIIDRILTERPYKRRMVHAIAEDLVRQRMDLMTAVLIV